MKNPIPMVELLEQELEEAKDLIERLRDVLESAPEADQDMLEPDKYTSYIGTVDERAYWKWYHGPRYAALQSESK